MSIVWIELRQMKKQVLTLGLLGLGQKMLLDEWHAINRQNTLQVNK